MPAINDVPNIHESLIYHPWFIPDPGPPWLLDQLEKEDLIAVAVNQLQVQKEVLAAVSAGVDRQLAILSRKSKR
jgi:hypothetical protein